MRAGNNQPLYEAPSSVNCHLVIDGRQVQLTLRDHDEGRLLERLEVVLKAYPVPQASTGPSAPPDQGQDWCHLHNVKLHLNHGKDGRTWYSHKTAEGTFCKGK